MPNPSERPLNLSDTYPCPICRQGTIEAIVLTEAFACPFCRHILSANLADQQVQVVDSSQPLTWLWNGQKWQLDRQEAAGELSGLVIFVAIALITIPAGLVWLSGNLFPPLEPNASLHFSTVWSVITLASHLTLVLWLIGEYYQIPVYVAAKVRIMRLRARRG